MRVSHYRGSRSFNEDHLLPFLKWMLRQENPTRVRKRRALKGNALQWVKKRAWLGLGLCTLVISSRWGSRAFLAWNPVALCSLPLRAALSAKAIHQRIDTFIRRPNTSRPEYLRHCCRSLHFSLIGDFDQTFIFATELLEVQTTHLTQVALEYMWIFAIFWRGRRFILKSESILSLVGKSSRIFLS